MGTRTSEMKRVTIYIKVFCDIVWSDYRLRAKHSILYPMKMKLIAGIKSFRSLVLDFAQFAQVSMVKMLKNI